MSPRAIRGRVIDALLLLACIAVLALLLCAPAHAKVLAEAPMLDGGVVLLHDEPGPCVGRAQLAEYFNAAGEKTLGCWITRGAHIALVFFDGDVGSIPITALRTPTGS